MRPPEYGDATARFFETPENRAPQGGSVFWLIMRDGAQIRVALWPARTPRGTVILLPGRTETLEKYFETIGDLLSRNFSVLTLDWRGQGASARLLSSPLKGHIADFSTYLSDLAAVLDEADEDCPRPWLVLAHSMGAHIALRALHEWPGDFAAAVLSAPMAGILIGGKSLVRALARIAPSDGFVPRGATTDPLKEPFEANPVTHDAGRFARNLATLVAHPKLALGAPTWGWLNAAMTSCAQIAAPGYTEAIRTPILMLSAGEETIVDNQAQQRIAARLQRCEFVTIAGSKHEILMETDPVRGKFWELFDRFVEKQISAIAR